MSIDITPPPPPPMLGPPAEGPGGGMGWGGWGDINIHIDINMNIDIHIIINMNNILGVGDHFQVLKVLEGTGTVLRTYLPIPCTLALICFQQLSTSL